jgi:hypothetical protein
MQFSWVSPIIVIFIVIILLAACIVCVAVQDSQGSRSRSYVRASTHDPWLPVEESVPMEREWEPSQYMVDCLVCSCGKWNAPDQSTCWNCNASLLNAQIQTFSFETAEKCAVCGYRVYPGDQIVLCPSCQAQGHRAHMLEFFKAKGCCPVCHQRLSSKQLLNTIQKIGRPPEAELAEE